MNTIKNLLLKLPPALRAPVLYVGFAFIVVGVLSIIISLFRK